MKIVGAGVAIIVAKKINNSPLILLGERKGSHGSGEWSMPGGKIQPGEDPDITACRELDEETGIAIAPSRIDVWHSYPFNSTITGGEPWVTLFFFALVSEDTKAKLMEPEKCSKWEFFSIHNPPSPMFEASADLFRKMHWGNVK